MLLQPTLNTPRLMVAPIGLSYAQPLLDYHFRNQTHLAPWEPAVGPSFFTLAFWQKRCQLRAREWQEGRCASFVLLEKQSPQQVIGTVSLSQMQRGVAQYAMLGYGLDQHSQGQGLMYEALQALVAFAFDELNLHRLQANYQPANRRSAILLARLGFRVEGHASQYLFLNGAWCDHVMTALINPHFDSSTML